MKRVLNRYARDADGCVMIDVAADKVEDLYSDYDKSAPYIRRDLDPDLVDYLINCAKELGREPFSLNFTLTHRPDEERVARIKKSMNNFFLYMVEVERKEIRTMFRRSFNLLSIGVAILTFSLLANRWLGKERAIAFDVIDQGLSVAAWVALWESLAVFLIAWLPRLKNIKIYRKLAEVRLTFRERSAVVSACKE